MLGLDEIALANQRAVLPSTDEVKAFVELEIEDFLTADPPQGPWDRGFLQGVYHVLTDGLRVWDEELDRRVKDVLNKSRREYPR